MLIELIQSGDLSLLGLGNNNNRHTGALTEVYIDFAYLKLGEIGSVGVNFHACPFVSLLLIGKWTCHKLCVEETPVRR